MKRLMVVVALVISCVGVAGALRPKAPKASKRAYFVFRDATETNEFVVQLRSPANILHARAVLAGTTTERPHIGGIIARKRAPYNPKWSYHLRPDSIEFFDFAIEVCDATMVYVEEHLDEVGGAFLPGSRWCPWSSVLVREIPRHG